MAQATPLSAFIGQRLRSCRETHGLRQDQLAFVARAWGLQDWTSATVAAIEIGRRRLSIDELVLLPWIAVRVDPASALRRPERSGALELSSFCAGGPDDQRVTVTDLVTLTAGGLQAVLSGQSSAAGLAGAALKSPRRRKKQATQVAAKLDAEVKVARKLGVPPERVVELSRRLWGQDLTAERDARVQLSIGIGGVVRLADESRTRGRPDAGRTRRLRERGVISMERMVQARRGHVTRALIAELQKALKGKGRK